ncbi:probable receptor-like serine/threonine-protein kinase At4g34500 [Morus notabilis]|uniref:probable receptor-like serine/threonine-protein kinase At4g34500 n=1 Tax=Morus notabilis TaxID=981085 RepID=UPI000CECE4AD|nr:probable receptor-like serine/threonine-protein kinase At4g34500 [Morus notabilis]
MDKFTLNIHFSNRKKSKQVPFSSVFSFVSLTTISLFLTQVSASDCVLDIYHPSSWNTSDFVAGNWGGFVNNSNCGSVFDDYLYALAQRANHAQKIFLNSTEQKNCLLVMNNTVGKDVSGCGFEKLTSGGGGCSDFSTRDVYDNLGNTLNMLDEDCKLFGSPGVSGAKACSACLRRWEEIVASADNVSEIEKTKTMYKSLNSSVYWTTSDNSCSTIEETSCLRISIKEVYLATNNLDLSNFIGQGVAGKVYKGTLSNGHHVAVKHIIKDRHVDTFIREVRSLSHIRHPNLVSLLGYCEAVDECFLVYELCHNGNLSEWLFGKDKTLLWVQRLQIAIDSAKGLLFLHTYPEGCIVHRDIKPTNILIDAKFQAKLSDFGLSKVMDLDQSYVSSEVRGTLGYVDPEYRRSHHVNPSGDVYSFGIVLLQLLSGQRAINLDLSRAIPLTKMARSLSNGGTIEEFADAKLEREYSSEAFDLVFKLALSCTGLKQQRPSMKQVVSRLEKAFDISTQFNSVT